MSQVHSEPAHKGFDNPGYNFDNATSLAKETSYNSGDLESAPQDPSDLRDFNRVHDSDKLKRSLSARQVQMIAIGGTIGTGLFLGTGKSLATGGPGSMVIGYAITGATVYITMLSLGEMSTLIPVAGSFCHFSGRFIDPAFGFANTWLYFVNDAVSTAADLVALQLILSYWTTSDKFPGWALSLIFWAILLGVNLLGVKFYGELEYWLSLLKVIAIIVFIIMGIAVNCGANSGYGYIGAKMWKVGEAPFVGGAGGFFSVFVTASFAYGGTESLAITAGETKNPVKTMPRVIKNVFWRILLFYILSVIIIGFNVPYNYPNLSNKSVTTSPFTIVFQMTGTKAAGSVINAVIMTSVLSAGNHALFAGVRLLYTLGMDRQAPRFVARLNRFSVPWVATIITSVIAGLLFGSSFIGAGQVWSWLQNLVGVSNQIAWISICVASIRFRKGLDRQGKTHMLRFKNWTYPWGPYIAAGLNCFFVLLQGWSSFKKPFSGVDFVSYYIQLPLMLVLFVGWKLIKRTKFVKYDDMDFVTDVYLHEDEKPLKTGVKSKAGKILSWIF